MKLGKTLKVLREWHGVKRPDLARYCKVSSNYLGMIETDKRIPSLPLLMKISKHLEEPLSEIFKKAEQL